MPSSPENSERLRKIALKAVAAMAGGTLVHYFWSHDRAKTEAYVYRFRDSSEGVLVGLIKGSQGKIRQFAGRLVMGDQAGPDFILEGDGEIDPAEITQLEEIVSRADSTNDPLQTG